MWSTISPMTVRALNWLLTLWLLLAITACASFSDNGRARVIPNSIAILGVVQHADVDIPINEFRLSRDLEDLLRDERRTPVMAQEQVRIALGKETHDLLLRRVAANGQLDAQDLRMLHSSNLRTSTAVILTITGNDVEALPEKRQKLRNSRGHLLNSREHRVLATQRKVSMTATVVELSVGRIRMHENFVHNAVEKKRYLKYSSSSLTGSVAASVANAVSNGVGSLKRPPAPPLYGSFYTLLNKVAEALPAG